jgi:transglutaminase-like putative cysteine protease
MRVFSQVLTAAALAAACCCGATVRAADPDVNAPYSGKISNPVTYQVDMSAVVTAPAKTKVLKVWVPLPPSDALQSVTEKEIYSFPMNVKPQVGQEPVFGNKFAYFEFKNPQGAQMIRHTMTVTTHDVNWNIDPAKVTLVEKWPESFAPYLRKETQAVVVNDEVKDLIAKIVPEKKNPYSDFTQVLQWADENLKYSHENASLQASTENALAKHGGHCSDYHSLCSAFGRALNSPTRVTYGINPFPKASPSHCKMEAYLAPYGWVSFDVSETQNLVGEINKSESLSPEKKKELIAKAHRRLLSGFRDNTWFKQTHGTDYDLAPKAAKRAAIVRTIYAEADGEALAEPDPGNPHKHEFAWMTMHYFKADKDVPYTFKDFKTLENLP